MKGWGGWGAAASPVMPALGQEERLAAPGGASSGRWAFSSGSSSFHPWPGSSLLPGSWAHPPPAVEAAPSEGGTPPVKVGCWSNWVRTPGPPPWGPLQRGQQPFGPPPGRARGPGLPALFPSRPGPRCGSRQRRRRGQWPGTAAPGRPGPARPTIGQTRD